MDKESQYRPESIRGKKPIRPVPAEEVAQPQPTADNTTIWDAVKAPFQGAIQGLFNTGIETRDQYLYQKNRVQRGLPRQKYKHPLFLNPFRRTSSSWFKDACNNKSL